MRPAVQFWLVVYGCVVGLMLFALAVWTVRNGWFPTEAQLARYEEGDAFWGFNRKIGVVLWLLTFASFVVPAAVTRGRSRQRMIVGSVYIALSMFVLVPLGLALMVFWLRDDNRLWMCSTT